MRGKVIFFNNAKGWGFVRPEAGQPDHFIHYSEIQMEGYKSLTEGQTVEYELGMGPNGKQQANSIRVVG